MIERKHQILNEVLANAAFDGWNETSMRKAAQKVADDERFAKVDFPNGVHDLSAYFSDICDAEMNKRLKKRDLKSMKIRERIKAGVMTRLEIYDEHKEAIRSIMSRRMMPDCLWKSITNVSHTVDDMWIAAGDKSTDYNYYSKRFILGGVYTSTLMFWLQDDSENFKDTQKFLARRVENVMQFEKLKGKLTDTFERFVAYK